MRRALNGKVIVLWILLVWVMVVRLVSGCSVSKDDGEKVRDLEFTVVGEQEVPDELKKIISEKMGNNFKLTYSNDQGLYIVVGYGQQATGGYSIAVNELYLTENSIVIDTELMGPEKGETVSPEPSCPFIVVKTEYLENPVIFK